MLISVFKNKFTAKLIILIYSARNCVVFYINISLQRSGNFTVSEGIASQTRRNPSLLMYKVVSKLPRIVGRYLPGAGFYQILDTDYDNYAILWSCTNYELAHTGKI